MENVYAIPQIWSPEDPNLRYPY